MSGRTRLVAWAEPKQAGLIRDALRRGRFELAAVGAHDAGAAAELSEALSAPQAGALRDAILHEDADLLWLASPRPIGADEQRLLRESGVTVISSTPLCGSIGEITRGSRRVPVVPLMRRSPGLLAARDVLDQLGRPRSMTVVSGCAAGEGTLFGRLFDAMDLVEALCGPAERLHAAPSGPVPETLAALEGHLSISLRLAEDRCAAVTVSDDAGRWVRRATLVGEGGCLHVDDGGFEWISPDGRTVDSHHEPGPLAPGELVAIQARRLLEGADEIEAESDDARLLALCEAARLSARTGETEVPARVFEILKNQPG